MRERNHKLWPDRDWADGERRAIWRRVFLLEEKLNEALHSIGELQIAALRAAQPKPLDCTNFPLDDEIPF